jgi:hypothetical protein
MLKRKLILLLPILLLGLFAWQLPNLLRAIPSRYVAAYLPEPVQALAVREQAEVLPTAAVQLDTSSLLANSTTPAEAAVTPETWTGNRNGARVRRPK